jgi:hypothetical protein
MTMARYTLVDERGTSTKVPAMALPFSRVVCRYLLYHRSQPTQIINVLKGYHKQEQIKKTVLLHFYEKKERQAPEQAHPQCEPIN